MFDEFVNQFKKLFSSKSNGGKLVYNLQDKLHYFKQILLAFSIILLLGYSQFRGHFHCGGTDQVDKSVVTNFCWINGTTTLHRTVVDDGNSSTFQEEKPSDVRDNKQMVEFTSDIKFRLGQETHVGIHSSSKDGQYELINHNYMRSLWAILIMMTICSYVASRKWANLFSDDLLKALLKLPGCDQMSTVKKAQDSYENLKKLPTPYNELAAAAVAASSVSSAAKQQSLGLSNLFADQGQVFAEPKSATIDILLGDDTNDYSHTLDYYPSQLFYLLLARNVCVQHLAGLKLRQKILSYSFWSLLLTVMQFVLPWSFIGPHYTLYGWNSACLALRHMMEQIKAYPLATPINSFDYELTSAIWPTSTLCEYDQTDIQGQRHPKVQCSVPINEICGKLFIAIWWFIAWTFGRYYWPNTRDEIENIINFRHRYADLLSSVRIEAEQQQPLATPPGQDSIGDLEAQISRANSGQVQRYSTTATRQVLSERQRKQLEADREDTLSRQKEHHRSDQSLARSKRWYLWCSRDVGLLLADKSKQLGRKSPPPFNRSTTDTSSADCDFYYLFYLLYLRLGCSRKKVEQVIQMTDGALSLYLEILERRFEWSSETGPISSSTTSTTIVPSSVSGATAASR